MSGINLPKNAHVSTHPCLQAKLSQLRSASTGSKDAQTLVHELALMVGYEALAAGLKAQPAGTVRPSFSFIRSHNITKWGGIPSHISIKGFHIPKTITVPQTIAIPINAIPQHPLTPSRTNPPSATNIPQPPPPPHPPPYPSSPSSAQDSPWSQPSPPSSPPQSQSTTSVSTAKSPPSNP
jgi:hypothetical protein